MSLCKTLSLTIATLSIAVFTLTAHANVVLPVDAAAWDRGAGAANGTGSGGLIDQTVSTNSANLNLNGQPSNPAVWTNDDEGWIGDFQGQDVDSLTGKPWIIYDLGAPYNLDKLYIITNVEANRGFKDIEIYQASDLTGNPVGNWASVSGLTDGAANVVEYDFTAGGWTQVGGTETLLDVNDAFGTQPQPATEIDISSVTSARYIGIRGLNSFNDDGGANPFGTANRAGINQIAFTFSPPQGVTLTGDTVSSNAVPGTLIGALLGPAGTTSFVLTNAPPAGSDADNSKFQITGGTNLRTRVWMSQYSNDVSIAAVSNGIALATNSFPITLTAAGEPAFIVSAEVTVPVNDGDIVGAMMADQDGAATFSIVGGRSDLFTTDASDNLLVTNSAGWGGVGTTNYVLLRATTGTGTSDLNVGVSVVGTPSTASIFRFR